MAQAARLASGRVRARRWRAELGFLRDLRRLPPRVARFQWRARRLAIRLGDEWSILSATRPAKLAVLLDLAGGRRNVVELGTATGWTCLSLLIADPQRKVMSLDVKPRPARDRYLALAGAAASARLTLIEASGEDGPPGCTAVDFLYVDSSHSLEGTLAEYRAWRPVMSAGGLIVFDDFGHPAYPGVRAAVQQLELTGEERSGLYVHRIDG